MIYIDVQTILILMLICVIVGLVLGVALARPHIHQ